MVFIALVLLTISMLIRFAIIYPIFNQILIHFGYDGLSLLQMCLVIMFIKSFTTEKSYFDEQMMEKFKKSLSEDKKVDMYITKAVISLLTTGIIYLIYFNLIVPKFLS